MNDVLVELIAGVFGILSIVVGAIVSKKQKAKKHEEVHLPKLVEHHIFARIEMLKNHIEVSFSLPNKGKEELFKDLLLSNLDVWKENLKELAEELDKDSEELDITAFQNAILGKFEEGLYSFSSYYKVKDYTYDEQVALDLVMAKFNKWNYPRVKAFRDTLMIVCTSQFYLNHRVKSAVIMDMYISFLVDIISDAESTIGEINGDLRGMVFKGITI